MPMFARCNYLSTGKPDIQCAEKEVCREMAAPTVGALKRLERIGRFLKGEPRMIWKFDYQQLPSGLKVFTDAN